MRWRLLRRRLTISAPRVAVRSAMPWPLRWALVAIVLGFCGAIALWAFELGKDLAGLDHGDKEELARLHNELDQMRTDLRHAQTIANTSGSLLTAEKAAQERLTAQIKQLEADNRTLRDDLGFFEKLMPATGNEGASIRGLQAEVVAAGQLRWQVLLLNPSKNAPEFNGRLELDLVGTVNGKPWTASVPQNPQGIHFRQYQRVEGMFQLPEQAVVKGATARIFDGNTLKATQTIKL